MHLDYGKTRNQESGKGNLGRESGKRVWEESLGISVRERESEIEGPDHAAES